MEPNSKPPVDLASPLAQLVLKGPPDNELKEVCPTLWELLQPVYRDGKMSRQPGTLRISAEGTAWRVTLECPTEGVQTSLTMESLVMWETNLEVYLTSGKVVWQADYRRRRRERPVV